MESWAAREADPKWTGGLWGPPVTWAAPPPRAPASGRKTRVCPLTVQQPCQSHPPGAGPESEATAALGHGQGRRGPPSGCGGAPPSSGGPSAGAGSMLLSGELPRCMLSSAEPTSPAELRGWGGSWPSPSFSLAPQPPPCPPAPPGCRCPRSADQSARAVPHLSLGAGRWGLVHRPQGSLSWGHEAGQHSTSCLDPHPVASSWL